MGSATLWMSETTRADKEQQSDRAEPTDIDFVDEVKDVGDQLRALRADGLDETVQQRLTAVDIECLECREADREQRHERQQRGVDEAHRPQRELAGHQVARQQAGDLERARRAPFSRPVRSQGAATAVLTLIVSALLISIMVGVDRGSAGRAVRPASRFDQSTCNTGGPPRRLRLPPAGVHNPSPEPAPRPTPSEGEKI